MKTLFIALCALVLIAGCTKNTNPVTTNIQQTNSSAFFTFTYRDTTYTATTGYDSLALYHGDTIIILIPQGTYVPSNTALDTCTFQFYTTVFNHNDIGNVWKLARGPAGQIDSDTSSILNYTLNDTLISGTFTGNCWIQGAQDGPYTITGSFHCPRH